MFAKGEISLSTDYILNLVSDVDLINYYFNITSIPCLTHSPLREDNNPSFSIFQGISNKVFFKDFGTNQTGDIFTLLSLYWNCSRADALQKIYLDLLTLKSTTLNTIYNEPNNSHKVNNKPKYDLDIKVRDIRKYDINYWEEFGITKEWLIFGNIIPISYIFLTSKNTQHIIPADKQAYAYIEYKDNTPTFKIYQPFNSKTKWLSNHDKSIWDLWHQLPQTGDKLIITSSRKDALCIWANCGIPATSLQAESYLPKQHVVNQLKERFKTIYILYDNDFTKETNYGQLYSTTLASKFNLNNITIPTHLAVKDSSDLYKKYGKTTLIQTITSLL